jgi:Fe-Mn family superoxide dismutase
MDVWEHAYYLKHKADRKSYIKDFFDAIDWEVVESRMK